MEVKFIKFLETRIPLGYNVAFGGQISPSTAPEVRAKISAARKGNKLSDSARLSMSNAQIERFKREDQRYIASKISSEAERTEEWNNNISAALIGREFSPEHRANLSKSRVGKKMTKESIEKIANSKRGKKASEDVKLRHKWTVTASWAIRQGRGYFDINSREYIGPK
jgi:hypothetical protein